MNSSSSSDLGALRAPSATERRAPSPLTSTSVLGSSVVESLAKPAG